MAAAGGVGVHNVFVYGSLMADEVVAVLLARVPHSVHALLPNFRRFSIQGRVYPAILPAESKTINGKVVKGITDAELEILDNFEDVEYIRKTVEVSLLDTSEKLFAEAYIWGNPDDPDLYGDWDFEEWKRLHMKDFIEMTKAFMDYSTDPGESSKDPGESSKNKRVETYDSFFKLDSSSDNKRVETYDSFFKQDSSSDNKRLETYDSFFKQDSSSDNKRLETYDSFFKQDSSSDI